MLRRCDVRRARYHRTDRWVRVVLLSVLLSILAAADPRGPVSAQTASNFNQRDDKYRLLGLKRAKEIYETAKRDMDRRQQLFQEGLISQAELDRARSTYAEAEVNYQQSLLAVLFEAQYVSVTGAVKFQARDGSKHVRLQIANTSGGGEEYQKLLGVDETLFRSLQPDLINTVYVSVQNPQGQIIGIPYEAKLEKLRFGEPQTIDFQLLQDLDAVTASLIYGNGSSRTMTLYLQKDASANRVLVQSEQFSQEIELGKSSSFDLALELFSSSSRTFRLEVANLPEQIDRYFRDPTSGARLSQFRFTESSNTRKASLVVTLPDRAAEGVPIDQPLDFYVLVAPVDGSGGGSSPQFDPKRTWTQEEINQAGLGYVRLELLPRGRGKLTVRAPQLLFSIRSKDVASLNVDIGNEGSRRLDNVEIRLDPPPNWTKQVDPPILPSLDVGDEKRVALRIAPAKGTAAGRYEVRMRTSALSDNQPINAEDKTITVEVLPGSHLFATVLLVSLVVGLVAAVVVFGVRLSRR
jgi:hypothetical protein